MPGIRLELSKVQDGKSARDLVVGWAIANGRVRATEEKDCEHSVPG